MRFEPTPIAGVVVVELEPHADDRGYFARAHCPQEFAAAGFPFVPVQSSLSRNHAARTLRGMHYQPAPHGEAKLVRVVRGRIHDVALDMRPGSATFGRWTAAELSADNGRALLIPEGVAHGFLTLEPDSDILYMIDRMFEPGRGRAVRWDDPAFAIDWPAAPDVLSPADAKLPDFVAER
ncbi:dTDP-4-dehydrorhamnose 3,5-epimerase [Rhizorhabdus dicambivorans]|uniref:dTDP-4-dehydrorhamnose 3,5-epimerase n=1 Tax=Rhizorhabdus dicambivorans TaxID=1850238 RepID=A0A2A4FS52_9SPHN|nr:dTDP-4-dehydrorhamnose 3,5-epimerase [Rhizorhabdus dicambivorans]ATE64038.1 dTDP-4-dehydrorhamnose 3,5-epimerase [Rhizorhabdus dicambivorans]PCE40231.1 dTDP-4-dehydrorhamnose 3,5-epimerase [Rhizorhabdus dicambivorans]